MQKDTRRSEKTSVQEDNGSAGRLLRLLGGALTAGAVALLAFGLYATFEGSRDDPARYAGWAQTVEGPAVAPASLPLTLDDHVQVLLPTLGDEDARTRRAGLDALSMALESGDAGELTAETREETAGALIELYAEADVETPEGTETREKALGLIVTKVKGETARAFTAAVLSSGPPGMRIAALKALLVPGAIRGGEVYDKAYELARGDAVPDALKPAILRRVRGRKSEGELLEFFGSDIGPRALAECAVELQNLHKPELMGRVLSRLEQAGLLENVKLMPWFSGKLLSEHIRAADGEELIRALRVVRRRPSLTRSTFPAVQERLAHAEPSIRRMAARLVPEAVQYEGIDAQGGEELLAARLEVETDPVVKGEIAGGLSEIRRNRRPPDPVAAEANP
ncbi:MAG: hypothetical protein ABII00_17070 [Elusimicrobiota bacterium]